MLADQAARARGRRCGDGWCGRCSLSRPRCCRARPPSAVAGVEVPRRMRTRGGGAARLARWLPPGSSARATPHRADRTPALRRWPGAAPPSVARDRSRHRRWPRARPGPAAWPRARRRATRDMDDARAELARDEHAGSRSHRSSSAEHVLEQSSRRPAAQPRDERAELLEVRRAAAAAFARRFGAARWTVRRRRRPAPASAASARARAFRVVAPRSSKSRARLAEAPHRDSCRSPLPARSRGELFVHRRDRAAPRSGRHDESRKPTECRQRPRRQ